MPRASSFLHFTALPKLPKPHYRKNRNYSAGTGLAPVRYIFTPQLKSQHNPNAPSDGELAKS